MEKNKLLDILYDYGVLTVGILLFCVGWTSFIIPNGMISGGVTGLSTILDYLTNGAIPQYISYFVINAVLLVLGFMVLGKGFGFKTIYAVLVSTVFFKILAMPEFAFLAVKMDDKFIMSVLGGLFAAVGIGMVILRGGSTGGVDILGMIINKYWPVSLGKVYIYCDLIIIASIVLVPGKTIEDMIYGYITMVTFSFAIDQVVLGRKSSVQILVFSAKYKEVGDFMITELDRGVTALNSVGWYSNSEGKVLLVIARKNQLNNIVKHVKEIDPHAFISVSQANSVYGQGFEEVKSGIKGKRKK